MGFESRVEVSGVEGALEVPPRSSCKVRRGSGQTAAWNLRSSVFGRMGSSLGLRTGLTLSISTRTTPDDSIAQLG